MIAAPLYLTLHFPQLFPVAFPLIPMPEIRFEVQWPDGQHEICYSPSLIVQDYFEPGTCYDLDDFQERARTALKIASDRVQVKYGRPCGLAIGQLQTLEERIISYQGLSGAQVQFLRFLA